MNLVAQWSLATSMLLVGVCVHLVARVWSPRRLFFVDLGRVSSDAERARSRRVVVVNALVTAFGVLISLVWPGAVTALLVGLVLPFVPITLLLVEIVQLVRSLPARRVPGRYAVPLDEPPPIRHYLSLPHQLALGALLIGSTAAFLWVLPRLPVEVPVHWRAAGVTDRYGSPGELWFWPGIMAFDWALVWVTAFGVARERWALPEQQRERYAELQMERRQRIVRLVEWIILAVHASLAVMWLGSAFGSLPGREELRTAGLVAGLILMSLGTIFSLALSLSPLVEVQQALRDIAQTDVLGTRDHGWRASGLIYYAPEDPALFVPKRVGIGQTLNFGRPAAWAFLGALTVVPLLLTLVVVWAAG